MFYNTIYVDIKMHAQKHYTLHTSRY